MHHQMKAVLFSTASVVAVLRQQWLRNWGVAGLRAILVVLLFTRRESAFLVLKTLSHLLCKTSASTRGRPGRWLSSNLRKISRSERPGIGNSSSSFIMQRRSPDTPGFMGQRVGAW